jgi:hypothetical protein
VPPPRHHPENKPPRRTRRNTQAAGTPATAGASASPPPRQLDHHDGDDRVGGHAVGHRDRQLLAGEMAVSVSCRVMICPVSGYESRCGALADDRERLL